MSLRSGLLILGISLIAFTIGCGKPSPSEQQPKPILISQPPEPLFQFPTANRALLKPNGETNFFTPTGPGRPWTSGAFGCVRNSGTRLHEGIDIRALQRDANGESTDPVFAARDGSVVYINTNTSASNYGKYVVLQHKANGLAIYTLYAHLSDVVDGLALGQNLKTGDRVGTLGRTSNTSDGISKARAHLHFEIGLQIHTQFESWFQHWYKDGKNHHDAWNGINLLGLDSAEILREDSRTNFDLLHYIKQQPALCRVQIHQANLEWADRFPELIVHEPNAEPLPLQAWEVHLNFNAIPIRLKPLFDEDLKKKSGGARYVLLEVDEEVRRKHPCRSLVFKRGARWAFTSKGVRALDLLTWQPPD